MNRRWVCNDVWMDIFPHFDRPQLGLKMALISPRFDALVQKHFDGKTELALWRQIEIRKDTDAEMPKLFVEGKSAEGFPLPDCPLPDKIRFRRLVILYIDHSVISFLRSNQHIFDKGTNLRPWIPFSHAIADVQRIWDVFVYMIWPVFEPNIHHLGIPNGDQLNYLHRFISSTILSDLTRLNSITSGHLFPDVIADDNGGPTATPSAGQTLSKWLHTPKVNGQTKRLYCEDYDEQAKNLDWINSFKKTFIDATTSVSYKIHFGICTQPIPIVPFELVNKRTNEKLTLTNTGICGSISCWLLKRCPISAAVQQQQNNDENLAPNLNIVIFCLRYDKNCIGRSAKVFSSPAGPSNDRKKK